MKKYLQILISSILSGFCITFGATVYLLSLNYGNGAFGARIAGAFMFCIGLYTIIHFGLWLYTGKVGYILDNKPNYILQVVVCFIGNAIGSMLLSYLIGLTSQGEILKAQATPIVNAKLNASWYSILIMSIMCGIMIYLAVEGHKRAKYNLAKAIFAFMPIILFILAGFEHVVANVTYFMYAGIFSWKALLYFVIMFFGNAIGSLIFDSLLKLVNYLGKEKEVKEEIKEN